MITIKCGFAAVITFWLSWLTNVLSLTNSSNQYPHLHCRDPDLGAGHDSIQDRRFLLITSHGGGIGNDLIFFPAAFYFAALTGRVSDYFRFNVS